MTSEIETGPEPFIERVTTVLPGVDIVQIQLAARKSDRDIGRNAIIPEIGVDAAEGQSAATGNGIVVLHVDGIGDGARSGEVRVGIEESAQNGECPSAKGRTAAEPKRGAGYDSERRTARVGVVSTQIGNAAGHRDGHAAGNIAGEVDRTAGRGRA